MIKNRKFTISAVIALAMIAITLICVATVAVGAQSTFDMKVDFASRYAVGTKVNIPAAKFKVSSGTLETKVQLFAPNGNEIAAEEYSNGSYTVKNKGTHKVVYTASDNGTELREEFTFEGYYPLYSVGKKASGTPYFGASEKYGGIQGRDGIVVSLASGDTFQWGEIIDLKGKTELDSLVKLYVTPNTLGTADVSKLCIVLTDIHDPDNYVTITFKKVTAVMVGAQWAEINTYVTAGSAEQLQSGMRENANGVITYEGKQYNIEAGTKMGTEITKLSLPGVPMYVQGDPSTISDEHFKNNPELITVSIDYSNSKVFAGRIDEDEKDASKREDLKFVADLDAEECFDTLWGGFTTGEVYLSIKGQEYLSSSLNFVVTEVNGESVSSKMQDGKNEVSDRTPPALTVDFPEIIPEGVVGVPYEVFSAQANDVYDGEIIPAVSVTYNRAEVELKDGKFTPDKIGTYAITYRATDYSGNYTRDSVYTKYVMVVDGDELGVTLGNKQTSGFVTGTQIPVASYTTANPRGEISVAISATLIKDSSGAQVSDGVKYTVENGVFTALEVGTYKVEYLVSDHIFTKSVSYEIKVDSNSLAAITDEPTLPKYYMSGMIYNSPSLQGYYWESGVLKTVDCSVSYSNDGVTYVNIGKLFTPTGNGVGYIKFSVNVGGKTAEKIVEVDVVDVGYHNSKLSLDKYFHVTEGNVTSSSNDKRITFELLDKASFDYVNLLQSESFSFEFEPDSLSTVKITLTDKNNTQLIVKYTYLDNGKTSVEVTSNGGTKSVTLNYDINKEEKGTQRLAYDNASGKLNVTAKRALDLSDIFAGFDGDVWMSVEIESDIAELLKNVLEGEDKLPSFSIYSLNEQRFATLLSEDRIAPLILVNIATGERKINDIFHLSGCVISDVLDSYKISYMYILTPSGEYAVAEDGTVLDYTADLSREYDIKLDEYGKYVIYYYTKDSAGNEKSYTVQISVVDRDPPTITTSEHDRYIKVGDVIKPADFTVSDNISSADQIVKYVYVTAPDGTTITQGEAKATIKGVYQIHYYALDAQGNVCILTFNITAN